MREVRHEVVDFSCALEPSLFLETVRKLQLSQKHRSISTCRLCLLLINYHDDTTLPTPPYLHKAQHQRCYCCSRGSKYLCSHSYHHRQSRLPKVKVQQQLLLYRPLRVVLYQGSSSRSFQQRHHSTFTICKHPFRFQYYAVDPSAESISTTFHRLWLQQSTIFLRYCKFHLPKSLLGELKARVHLVSLVRNDTLHVLFLAYSENYWSAELKASFFF